MRQLTIAELREKDVQKLADIMQDREKAKRFFNSFYRLAGLEWRLLHYENNERFYTRNYEWIKAESNRAYSWACRLNAELKPYGYKLYVSGGYLQIYKEYPETGALGECLTRGWWYR